MATSPNKGGASASPNAPLDLLLSAIPSLPRPVLSRLTARIIERLDEIDGDPDLEEDDEDTGIEDDPLGFDPETDYGAEELGEFDYIGPDMRPIADATAYREHRSRLQRERCYKLRKVTIGPDGGYISRRLWIEPTAPNRRQLLRRKRGVPRNPRA